MLSVTTPALERLHDSVLASPDPDKCFRIVTENGTTLALRFTEFEDSDKTFEYKGRMVLALPDGLEKYCEDKSLTVNKKGRFELATSH